MGPYKLTRYKVYEEPPKLVVIEPSDESHNDGNNADEDFNGEEGTNN
jgi:hypothetical protein